MRRRRSNPQPEVLEQRALLSNVTVSFKNGDVLVKGDSGDNTIEVTQEDGTLWVRGSNGTTVNGYAASGYGNANFPFVPDDVKLIFSKGGKNEVHVDVDVGDDVLFKGGRDADLFSYTGVIGDDLKVVTSNGDDLVSLRGNIGNTRVATGGGDDLVGVEDSVFRENLNVKTGSGDDLVEVEDPGVQGVFNINFGSGNDDFTQPGASDPYELRMNGGSGFDRHNLGTSFKGFENNNAADSVLRQRRDELVDGFFG